MKILVTGLCTLHWGRLENGNVGNYYIIEPFFRELHRAFPNADIVTTFQMSDEFSARENIDCLPMDIYYSWSDNDVDLALKEYSIADLYNQTGQVVASTPYIKQVISSDMIIDISGEMWGDKADAVGKDRFFVNLLKMRVAQLFRKCTVLYAVSAGPFSDEKTKLLAQTTFESFSLVTIREPETTRRLKEIGFELKHARDLPCPSYLFEPANSNRIIQIFKEEDIKDSPKPTVGMIVCGFNLELPYDKWPREDAEYAEFAIVVEHIVNDLGARVLLLSHSNGFDLVPEFKVKPGRDYHVIKQLQQAVQKRGRIADMNNVLCIENAYTPAEIKGIIGTFEMLVTGRVHASVAAVSQCVPTVFVTYEKEEDSGKTLGFASIADLQDYVAIPISMDMIKKVDACFYNRDLIKNELRKRIPKILNSAKQGFDALREVAHSID